MKAARLYELGQPLKVEHIPEPKLRPGGAIVKVLSTHVPPFTDRVLSGALGYSLPTPFPVTPCDNAVGIVEAVAGDVFDLQPGQIVFCDPFISSHTNGKKSDAILIGWTGLEAASSRLQALWKDGAFAQKALWPAECLTPLPGAESIDSALLACLNYLTIPYGGFLRGGVHAGQTLIVNGATGGLGSAAVLIALALGVSRIVAVGRNQEVLQKLVQLAPQQVVSVCLEGNFSDYSKKVTEASEGADVLLDVLGGLTSPEPTLACIQALRPRGTAVLMGGVKADIPLPYDKIMLSEITVRGAFMYPRHVPGELYRMVVVGILNLSAVQTHVFALDQINEAIAEAARLKGLDYCVVTP